MNPALRIAVLAAAAAVALPRATAAPNCRSTSEPLTLPLVELYTSEGCDSCPPADRWLSRNFAAAGAGPRAVALAFHVDYWDRLGWVDRFASPRNTERQYAAMRANGATFVYTPQVLVQGRNVSSWHERAVGAAMAAARTPARATLTVEATPSPHAIAVQVDAAIADAALRRDAVLFIGYVDSGLSSDVRAGENRGARLSHDHVVRDLQRAGAPDAAGRMSGRVSIARPKEPGIAPMLVAFVQRSSNGDVLQTAILPLDGCGS